MRQILEANDRVRINNTNLECHDETGRIIEREPLGPEMFVYKVELDSDDEVKVDGPSVSLE